MVYILMNKDKEIAQFSIEHGDFGDTYSFSAKDKSLLPIGFTYIEAWLENRKASKHNAHLRQIMIDCGCDKPEGFIRVTHAASINDTFWIKREDESVRWDKVSFYRNEFDEVVSKLAFEGIGLYGLKLSSTSPELSTDGSFRKCWRREDGEIYLYKRGSSGARNAGLEPYCERLGSEISNHLIKHSVAYDLVKLHGELASKCKAFTSEQYGYVPIARYEINHSSPPDMMKFYEKIGSEDDFRRMIVVDALTFNVDRHAGNHGVLIDNETQKAICMAPIFDMNIAMLPYVEKDEFSDIGRKLMEYGPRIGDDFTRMGQQAMTSAIRADLINLKGFEFSFRGDDNFSEERVKALEHMVNRQIDALLSREQLYTRDIFVPEKQNICKTEKVEHDNPVSAAKEDQILNAQNLGRKLMDTGYFLEQSIEEEEHKVFLHITPKGYLHSEIIIDMQDLDITIETDGIGQNAEELKLREPKLYDSFVVTAKIIDGEELSIQKECFCERKAPELQKDDPELE